MVYRRFAWHFHLALTLWGSLSLTSAQADFLSYIPNGDESKLIDFGSGEDGAFSDGPTQSGITVAGANITFDTDVKSEFHFSSFTLSGGITATVTGSRPLVIKTIGNISIAGTLRANGGNGGASTVRSGGTNQGSGATGGVGAPLGGVGVAATAGTSSHSGSSGGGIRPNPAGQGDQASGGGGCFGQSGAGANDTATAGASGSPGGSAATCSTSRATIADRFETEFLGGGSGGGGSSWNNGASDADGGGGGAGGGALRLSALRDLSITGTLQARGGAGGNGGPFVAQDCGGAGGGGSGGAIWIQVGGTYSGNGTISVAPGSGGVNVDCGYTGGNGSRGVIRLDASTNTFAGTYAPVNATDLTYSMTEAPVVTDFNLKGNGMACGSLARAKSLEDKTTEAIRFFLFFIILYGIKAAIRSFTVRRSTS